jgi:site-specific DNA-methyltransferase (adenine-specific)
MEKEKLAALKASILSKGLLHPPVYDWHYEDDTYHLVAGERRTTVLRELDAEGLLYRCDGQLISPGDMAITLITDLNPIELFEAEFEENFMREDLTWQDRVRALAQLHDMRKALNPTQTVLATAEELSDATQKSSFPLTVRTAREHIAEAKLIAPHLDDPTIAQARNQKEAANLVLKREHEKYQAELHRKLAIGRKAEIEASVRVGDLDSVLPLLDPNQFDLILTDPPYGLNASSDSYRTRPVHHHNYDDSFDNARSILRTILMEGWRVTKPKANVFIFTEMMHWDFLQQFSAQMGWSTWKWPIIWQKSEGEGLAPWGRSGFIHTYDIIFWATKGQRGLNKAELDILTEKRVARNLRVHAAEKPVALLELMIDFSTLPGDRVLDPCCGSGSTLVAAKRMKRNSLGIELDQSYADSAIVRLNASADGEDYKIPTQLEDDGMPVL